MNPAEQKHHKRVTDDLRRDLEDVAGAMVADLNKLGALTAEWRGDLIQRIDAQAAGRAVLADRLDKLTRHVQGFTDAGFLARLRWIVFGVRR